MKGRTSEFSLEGEIVSTEILTLVAAVTLIAGLFVVAIVALYRRRLAKAALAAAALFAALHIVFVSLAWEGVAVAYLDAPLTVQQWEVAWPPISSLPTAAYDTSAWAAVVFLTTSIVLGVIEWRRRKAAEKEMAGFLMNFFEVNESKENESEED